MNSLADHVLFVMQFQQMREDFANVMFVSDECPACGKGSAPDTICLAGDCDWMLFTAPGKFHPATIPWLQSLQERI
jgi:hypothetical protein